MCRQSSWSSWKVSSSIYIWYKCRIANFIFLLWFVFLIMLITDTPPPHTKHTHRLTTKNAISGFRGPQNVKIHQNFWLKNLPRKKYFLYHIWQRESNNEHAQTDAFEVVEFNLIFLSCLVTSADNPSTEKMISWNFLKFTYFIENKNNLNFKIKIKLSVNGLPRPAITNLRLNARFKKCSFAFMQFLAMIKSKILNHLSDYKI